MVSLIFKLAIALVAIKLVAATALPASANPRREGDKLLPSVSGVCESYGNRFARVDSRGVNLVYSWVVGNPTPSILGTPYCFLSGDPNQPLAIRWAWPIIGDKKWLIVYTTTNGRFVGFSFLQGGIPQ